VPIGTGVETGSCRHTSNATTVIASITMDVVVSAVWRLDGIVMPRILRLGACDAVVTAFLISTSNATTII